ncbi:MAG: DnaA/Hda family protein [Lautropia sp.]|nr:DnaA/Hda family protein [Lautropia sp.]
MESQLTLDFGPPPPPGFDNFVAGANLECLATLRHLVHILKQNKTPDQRFFYIWGPHGVGKSHLASALSNSQCPNLMVVDDVDQYSKNRQRTLFHRFNAMIEQPGQALVVFGHQPPARLPLLPELVSRLGWGMVFALHPLDDDALADALEKSARERGLRFGQDLSNYLLRHTRRDMASLKTILDGLDHLAWARKKPLTLPLLKDYLQAHAPPPAGKVDQ